MSGTPNLRLKQIMEILVKHLHAFAREADLTPEEWIQGIGFLTAVGQKCTAFRQEFILLSDTLGLSAMVNSLNDKRGADIDAVTKSSLLGPFYRKDSPLMDAGSTIATKPTDGIEICLYGKATDTQGRPIPQASVEVWQPDEHGDYDLQKLDPSEMDLRGRFYTDAQGHYHLRTICPVGYTIPMDGPVGDMIRAQARHGCRPSHIHFLINAPGYREMVTALYIDGDPHIDSDTVFGASDSLVVSVKKDDPASPIPGLPAIGFDFHLAPTAAGEGSGRVGADPSEFAHASH
jgi:catechol 1,2-dioxygenase/hydroxyquinol 1,2-dioxygenase